MKASKGRLYLFFLFSFVVISIAQTIFVLDWLGLESLRILLQFWLSSWLPLQLLVVLIISAFLLYMQFVKYRRRQPGEKFRGFVIIAMSVLLLVTVVEILIYVKYRVPKSSSLAQQGRVKLGPFIQFEIKNHFANLEDNNFVIWIFDPKSRNHTLYLKNINTGKQRKIIGIQDTLKRRTEFRLKNMESGKYIYTIPSFQKMSYEFMVPQSQNSQQHILVLGDTRNRGEHSPSYYGFINSLATKFYKKEKINPYFKIHLGDIVFTGTDLTSWKYFNQHAKIHAATMPYMLAVGNHELYNDRGGNLSYFFHQPFYYVLHGKFANFLFIHNFDGIFGLSSRKQRNFVKKTLRQLYNKKWLIVSIHVPLLSTGDYNYNQYLIKQYLEMFKKYKVDMVLSGHDHHYEAFHLYPKSKWGGTYYMVNGTGGDKIDYYIMKRRTDKWFSWFHDRNSEFGLYQKDKFTQNNHLYAELSWGFSDLSISKNELSLDYYRWLSLPEYLELAHTSIWDFIMLPVKELLELKKKHALVQAHSVFKYRRFDP